MSDKPTLTARLEDLREQQTKLEAEARTRRTELIDELRVVCSLAGKVPRELLDDIVDGRRRGPKPGAKKAAKKKKPTVTATEEVPA